ncbi:MAG: SEC-C domain-containing protein [Xanthomonadales bacterium]|nr:SEC-C domain-containing protein [Xanthomonadales bacterium]
MTSKIEPEMTSLNAACPCGSGKKFKRCHGKAPSSGSPNRTPQQLLEHARSLAENGQADVALQQLRQLPPAPARYDLEVKILQRQGAVGVTKAEKVLRKWQQSDIENPDPVYRRMQIAWQQGRFADALRLTTDLNGRSHKLVEYYRAVAFQLAGQLDAAMTAYSAAVSEHLNLDMDVHTQTLEAAIQMYDTAAGRYPGNTTNTEAALIDAQAEYAVMSLAAENWWSQRTDFSSLAPAAFERYTNAMYNLGCRDQECYARNHIAIDYFERVLQMQPGHIFARSNWCFLHNYRADISATENAQAHMLAGREFSQQASPVKNDFMPAPIAGRRLRIAYLSADFHKHSVAYFITPVLEAHDRERFEVFAYHNSAQEDGWSHRARQAVDVFRNVASLSDSALYQQILADRIDVLVDLSGYSRGNRVAVLARRAAPVQISWIGYPGSSGLTSMDYRIVDETTDPTPSADALCSEVLLRLPKVFSVYTPPADLPEPAALDKAKQGFVFASFNHLLKLNLPLLKLWAKILHAVPDSRLLIKSQLLDRITARRDLSLDLQAAGIDLDRVELLGRLTSNRDHMACYRKAGLLLDSFPYNGTTTNCDSFIMGVPVLTIAGDSHLSRVTASQLSALNLPELIATDEDDYIQRAVDFANHPEKLHVLSKGLRERMQNSPLMNAAELTADVESLYRQTWVQYTHKSFPPQIEN